MVFSYKAFCFRAKYFLELFFLIFECLVRHKISVNLKCFQLITKENSLHDA
jgi:hypothetical protein